MCLSVYENGLAVAHTVLCYVVDTLVVNGVHRTILRVMQHQMKSVPIIKQCVMRIFATLSSYEVNRVPLSNDSIHKVFTCT